MENSDPQEASCEIYAALQRTISLAPSSDMTMEGDRQRAEQELQRATDRDTSRRELKEGVIKE